MNEYGVLILAFLYWPPVSYVQTWHFFLLPNVALSEKPHFLVWPSTLGCFAPSSGRWKEGEPWNPPSLVQVLGLVIFVLSLGNSHDLSELFPPS